MVICAAFLITDREAFTRIHLTKPVESIPGISDFCNAVRQELVVFSIIVFTVYFGPYIVLCLNEIPVSVGHVQLAVCLHSLAAAYSSVLKIILLSIHTLQTLVTFSIGSVIISLVVFLIPAGQQLTAFFRMVITLFSGFVVPDIESRVIHHSAVPVKSIPDISNFGNTVGQEAVIFEVIIIVSCLRPGILFCLCQCTGFICDVTFSISFLIDNLIKICSSPFEEIQFSV